MPSFVQFTSEQLAVAVSRRLRALCPLGFEAVAAKTNLPLDHVVSLLSGTRQWSFFHVARFLFHFDWDWQELQAEAEAVSVLTPRGDFEVSDGSKPALVKPARLVAFGTDLLIDPAEVLAVTLFEGKQVAAGAVKSLGMGTYTTKSRPMEVTILTTRGGLKASEDAGRRLIEFLTTTGTRRPA